MNLRILALIALATGCDSLKRTSPEECVEAFKGFDVQKHNQDQDYGCEHSKHKVKVTVVRDRGYPIRVLVTCKCPPYERDASVAKEISSE